MFCFSSGSSSDDRELEKDDGPGHESSKEVSPEGLSLHLLRDPDTLARWSVENDWFAVCPYGETIRPRGLLMILHKSKNKRQKNNGTYSHVYPSSGQ